MKQRQLLVAAEKCCLPMIGSALNEYVFVAASNTAQVFQIIEKYPVDLFLVDIHFDDSSALDLVSALRKNPVYENTPIVLFRHRPSEHAKLLRTSVLQVVVPYKIPLYIELDESEDAASEVRTAVDALLIKQR